MIGNNDFTGNKFDSLKTYIFNLRKTGKSWDDIKNMSFLSGLHMDFEQWNSLQQLQVPDWTAVSKQTWKEIVEDMEETERKEERYERLKAGGTLKSDNEINEVKVSSFPKSSWQLYKKTLENKGFSEKSINRIEKQTLEVLQNLSTDTRGTEPRKGLVIGNVQSGKTANMAALMAMAADNGWNYFVILTGLTENLRNQTEIRLEHDLNHNGNVFWSLISYQEMDGKKFNWSVFNNQNRAFFSVVLKNSKRLQTLITFLQKAKNPESIRMIVIDDEADQGSVNTGNVKEETQRKAINQLILNLVYGEKHNRGKYNPNPVTKPFGALNYVSYTATPYANCLNEEDSEGHHTLYPENFISRISSGDGYFGPLTIFGMSGSEAEERMDIVNFIPDSENNNQVEAIKDIESGQSAELPSTLKDSILWFLCAASVFRYWKIIKPVSMLIHTSFKTDAHTRIFDSINSWLKKNGESLIENCRSVYNEQTEKFSLEDLKTTLNDYEYLDSVQNYPQFDDLIPFLQDLLSEVSHIKLNDEEGDFTYNKGILMCEDNSKSNKVHEDEDSYLRLVYPSGDQLKEMGYAPAFIVVGGNTLARGLTLEGLVSTFFLRNSIQADSLMQMGRWFGYRRGYELLPRIWMTKSTFDKFQYLVDIDEDLREQIRILSEMKKTPKDFQLSLISHPKANWLRLTSKNKMQNASEITLDYTGDDMQLVTYPTNREIVQKNNEIIEEFLESLGEPVISEFDHTSCIWMDIPFEKISDGIFTRGFEVTKRSRAFQNIESFRNWIEEETENNHFKKWTVILAGRKTDQLKSEEIYHLKCYPDKGVGKVNRTGELSQNGNIQIGVLTNKNNYVAHLRKEDLPENDPEHSWTKMKQESRMSNNYKKFLKASTKRDIPLLLIYCVDKNSRPKRRKNLDPEKDRSLFELGMPEDFFGLAFVIPGTRGKHPVKVHINRDFYDDDEDGN